MKQTRAVLLVLVAACVLAMPGQAEAYIGPGAGITVIGTVVAFFAALVFAIVGFVWYPIKRLMAAMRNRTSKRKDDQKPVPS